MKYVAIMQPTFFPWSGLFGMIDAVDLFIFLDSVQFSRRSWQQRNQIKTSKGIQWLTVPVKNKGKRDQLICEVEIDQSKNWAEKIRKTIEANYSKATYFKEFGGKLHDSLVKQNEGLAALNINIIKECCTLLGIETPFLRSSEMSGVGKKENLLASLCKEVGASDYIAAPGSMSYLSKSNAFHDIKVQVRYFNYNHPEYIQLFGNFMPYMSVIDMIFNCSGDKSKELIQNSYHISP